MHIGIQGILTDPTVVIIGSFLLAFKAILVEGSEVAILSLATIKQLGRNNILFGVVMGGLGSIVTFVEKDLRREGADPRLSVVPFSVPNSLPVLSITLTEGFEASLVLAAAGAYNFQWTLIGAGVSLLVLIIVSAISYDYLMRVPRWLLDIIAGLVLLSFGLIFFTSGVISLITGST